MRDDKKGKMHDEEMKVFLYCSSFRGKKVISVTFSAVVAGHTPMISSRTLFKAISVDAALESKRVSQGRIF